MTCHISEVDFEKACSEYNKCLELGRRPTIDLYLILIGALTAPFPANSAAAQKLLVGLTPGWHRRFQQTELAQKVFFLNYKTASELLTKASQDKTKDIAVVNMVWDLSQNRGVRQPMKVTAEYSSALERSGVPLDDPRLSLLRAFLEESRRLFKGPTSTQLAPPDVSLESIVAAETFAVREELGSNEEMGSNEEVIVPL